MTQENRAAPAGDKERVLNFEEHDTARQLFGEHNRHLLRIQEMADVRIHARGTEVTLRGDPINVDLAENLLSQLYGLARQGFPLYETDVDQAVRILSADHRANLKDIFLDTIFLTSRKKPIAPKSPAQKAYIEAIRHHDIVFGIGPAGTGKTYLAMAMAVAALAKGQVNRLVLTRPAVEAGEALGFLPGDLAEKVNPYRRPLYDALHDMIQFEKVD
ncbi:MAG: PhoH family protein, partial [Proteobacteria bacterium]|nr:PhoH family protein [Pseudomonadota bacterium]